jgi:hypothetical protein
MKAATGGEHFTLNYDLNGNMKNLPTSFTYNGNLMTGTSGGENLTLGWDNNGNLTSNESQATSYEYNWDNKLRSAQKGSGTISLRYDPLGNRIWKNSSSAGSQRYIVDVVGDLPVILMELDGSGSIKKHTSMPIVKSLPSMMATTPMPDISICMTV